MRILNTLRYRHKIAIIILLFALLPILVLGWFLTDRIWNGKVNDILSEKNVQLAGSASGFDNLLSSNINKILYISNNYYLINYLETNTDQNLIGIMNFSDYLQSVMGAVNSDNYQAEIAIYALNDTNYDGDHLRSISRLESEFVGGGISVKDEILNAGDDEIVWKIRTAPLNVNSDEEFDYLFAYKKIISLNRPLAIMEMRIPISQMLRFFAYDIPKGSHIVFEGTDGQYRLSVLGEETSPSPDGSYYVLKQVLHHGIGIVTWQIPKSHIFKELQWYWISVVAIVLIIVAILLITVEMVSHYLTRKLETLLRKMNKNVESLINDDDTMQIHASQDEFSKIEHSFYELLRKVKEYYRKITEFELERKVLETQLLQERFNPHFLYNTLSTIRWISEDPKVKDVVTSMVKYYRIALNKGSSIITITQELEMIEEYLRLQKFAYGTEFHYVIEHEDGIGRYLIMKHLLQPIVENAVLHGLNGRDSGGVIRIEAKKRDGEIVFEISDNGKGIAPEKLALIMQGSGEGSHGGYGMKNIQKRLDTFYDQADGFSIMSEQGGGTTVTIRVPAMPDAEIPLNETRKEG
jgi:sensor histidine kinase YesM